MTAPATTTADVLVIFGITGDLARKMTFRSLYRLERRQMLQCPIIGVARDQWSAATLRDHARRAIEDTGETIDEDTFQRFAERLSMISGDYGDPKTYDRVAKAIEAWHTPVFYLEIPPSLFGEALEHVLVDRLVRILDGFSGVIPEGRGGPLVAGHADDRALEHPAALQAVQGREGHLLRQVSGDTEDHQHVCGRGRWCSHGTSLSWSYAASESVLVGRV